MILHKLMQLKWQEYQVLLGLERGPRFGSFAEIYGIPETRALIAKALSARVLAGAA